ISGMISSTAMDVTVTAALVRNHSVAALSATSTVRTAVDTSYCSGLVIGTSSNQQTATRPSGNVNQPGIQTPVASWDRCGTPTSSPAISAQLGGAIASRWINATNARATWPKAQTAGIHHG